MRYLTRIKYNDGCSARAKFAFFNPKGHDNYNHESSERDMEVMRLKSKLKRKSQYSRGTHRKYLMLKFTNLRLAVL